MMIDNIYISIRINRYYDFDKAKCLLYFSQKISIYSPNLASVEFAVYTPDNGLFVSLRKTQGIQLAEPEAGVYYCKCPATQQMRQNRRSRRADNLEVIMEEYLKHQTGYKRQLLNSMKLFGKTVLYLGF
jgi:hypothetical protein